MSQCVPQWSIPADIDPEVVDLCAAINKIPGVQTIESCCGHGSRPFKVWFVVNDLVDLPHVLYWFDGCHCGFYGWDVVVTTDCAKSPVTFKIQGPAGDQGFAEAKEIARLITKDLPNIGDEE